MHKFQQKDRGRSGKGWKTVEEKSHARRDWAGLGILRVVPHVTVLRRPRFSPLLIRPISAEPAGPIEIQFFFFSFLLCLLISHILRHVAMWRCTSRSLSHTRPVTRRRIFASPARDEQSHTKEAHPAEGYVGLRGRPSLPSPRIIERRVHRAARSVTSTTHRLPHCPARTQTKLPAQAGYFC